MEWTAEWIWAGPPAILRGRAQPRSMAGSYVYARTEIDCGPISRAVAHVTALMEYKLYVNGRYIGRGPGPRDPGIHYYDEYDLTRIIRQGRNAIAAICHAPVLRSRAQPLSIEAVRDRPRARSGAGFLLRLALDHNGDTTVFGTDGTWKVKCAEDYASERDSAPKHGACEVYDTRLKPVGWNVAGFDDTTWEDACITEQPDVELIPRDIPPLREWEVFPEGVAESIGVANPLGLLSTTGRAATVQPRRPGSITLDFGREIVGFPIIRVRDSGLATINIGYATLGRDLKSLPNVGPRSIPADVVPLDCVTVHGGRREWQAFHRRAFRYLRLFFHDMDAPLEIESVSASRIGYPVEQVSTFECSDEAFNQSWREGIHALCLCMQDGFEDDPAQGSASTVEVARVQALANYYCFFDTLLPRRAIRRFARTRKADPTWIIMLHDYYLYTADRSLVEELYPRVRRLAPLLAKAETGEVGDAPLLTKEGSGEVDTSPRLHLTHSPAPPLDACRALRDAAKLASAVGEIEDAVEWHDLAETLLRTTEVYTDRGLVPSPSIAQVYILAAETLGVKPSIPESGVVVIQPRVGDLQWARGHVKTHRGFVDVEWRSEADCFTIDIDAPEGFLLGLPTGRFRDPVIDEIDLDPETPEQRARRTYGWGTTIWRGGEEHDPYVDWLSTQEAEPPDGYERRKRCSVEGDHMWIRECLITHVRYVVHETESG